MSKKLFLHLEDNRIAQRVLQNTFREIADFVSARTVSEAEKLIESLPEIECFIVDYHLETQTGFDFIKKVRMIQSYDLVPVILMTSTITSEIAYKAMRIGVNQSVSKLESAEVVRKIVTEHIERPHTQYFARTFYEVECISFEVARKYFQYCPDLDKSVIGDTPEEAANKMRAELEDSIFNQKLSFYITDVQPFIHRIDLKGDTTENPK